MQEGTETWLMAGRLDSQAEEGWGGVLDHMEPESDVPAEELADADSRWIDVDGLNIHYKLAMPLVCGSRDRGLQARLHPFVPPDICAHLRISFNASCCGKFTPAAWMPCCRATATSRAPDWCWFILLVAARSAGATSSSHWQMHPACQCFRLTAQVSVSCVCAWKAALPA